MAITSLGGALYGLITTDQSVGTVYDDLSGRIYSVEAPANVTYPMMVISEVFHVAVEGHFDGFDHFEVEYQIDLWDTTEGGRSDGPLQTTNRTLYNLLKRGTITSPPGYDRGKVLCVDRGTYTIEETGQGRHHRITSEWLVMATTTA